MLYSERQRLVCVPQRISVCNVNVSVRSSEGHSVCSVRSFEGHSGYSVRSSEGQGV